MLMVCPRYLPEFGGTEMHVHEVTRRLSALGGFEITVLTTDRSRRLPREEVVEGISVLRVPAWPRRRDYYLAPGIAAVIRRRGWDLVHCQGIHNLVPLIAMISARQAGIPYLVTFHTGGHSSRLRNAMRTTQWRLAGPLLRNAVSLIAVSRFEAAALTQQARLGDSRVMVIRNGGTLPPPGPGTVAVPGRIVSSGRLVRYKGHQRVIEALPYVMRDIPEAHLLILGSGPYKRDLYELARHLGVYDRVSIEHVAPADRQGMATALAGSCVVAALSDYEAQPRGGDGGLVRRASGRRSRRCRPRRTRRGGVGPWRAARRACRRRRPRARHGNVVSLAGGLRPAAKLGLLRRPACACLPVVTGHRGRKPDAANARCCRPA